MIRDQLLRAATALFSRYGYRRTSVDLIAAEAGVAKATLYAHFDGKEALFRGVCEHVAGEFLTAARAAADGDGELASRLLGVLSAKFGYFYELVDRSPHAAELLSSKDSHAQDIFERADRQYKALLRDLLAGAGLALSRAELTPSQAAALLMRSAEGASSAANPAEHRRQLAELVRLFLAATRR
jgi:AcrR family transcriptional regulator